MRIIRLNAYLLPHVCGQSFGNTDDLSPDVAEASLDLRQQHFV
jgi:hypothetical protein